MIEAYNRERFSNDDRTLIRWCLSVPQKLPQQRGRPFIMLDAGPLVYQASDGPAFGVEFMRLLSRADLPYAVAGLRRHLLDATYAAQIDFEMVETMRLDRLANEDCRALVEQMAKRSNVSLGEATRDLIVEQFEGSPLFISLFVNAAREKSISLTS